MAATPTPRLALEQTLVCARSKTHQTVQSLISSGDLENELPTSKTFFGLDSLVSMTRKPMEEASHQIEVPDDESLTSPRVQVARERTRDEIGMGFLKFVYSITGLLALINGLPALRPQR